MEKKKNLKKRKERKWNEFTAQKKEFKSFHKYKHIEHYSSRNEIVRQWNDTWYVEAMSLIRFLWWRLFTEHHSAFNHSIKNEYICLFSRPFAWVILLVASHTISLPLTQMQLQMIFRLSSHFAGIEKVCTVRSFHPVNCKSNSIIIYIEHWIVVHIMTWQIYLADNRKHTCCKLQVATERNWRRQFNIFHILIC